MRRGNPPCCRAPRRLPAAARGRASERRGGQTTRPGSFPALTLLGLSTVPCPPRHAELEPRFPGLDGSGAVLDPGAAGFAAFHVQLVAVSAKHGAKDRHGAIIRAVVARASEVSPILHWRSSCTRTSWHDLRGQQRNTRPSVVRSDTGSILGFPRIEVDSFDLPLLEVRHELRGNAQWIAFLDCQHRAFGMRAPSMVGRRIPENRAG